MKKVISISIFLILVNLVSTSGQEAKNTGISSWSISLSYSPKIDISPYYYYNEPFVNAINIKTDHKIADRLSCSFGMTYSKWIHYTHNLISDGLGDEISTNKIDILEFPVQLNYYFRNSGKIFDPYAKMSLNNAYFHQYYYGEAYFSYPDVWGPFSHKRSKYALFYNVGFGTLIKLHKNISLLFETAVGFGLVYYIPKYTYLEGQIGLKYTF